MKTLVAIVLFILPFHIQAQIITTIDSGFEDPTGIVFDNHDNYYVVEGLGNKIMEVNASTGVVTTFAGSGGAGYSPDGGLADTTNLGGVGGATFDSTFTYLYIADGGCYKIRAVNVLTNIISTTVGDGVAGFGGDGGPATSAMIQPNDICFDKFGNTFICDAGNARIRKIDPSGVISTYAGTGVSGWNADSGIATAVELGLPRGIATDDSGNLYIADNAAIDACVWKVNTSGIITTFAGNHASYVYNGDGIPATTAYLNPVRVVYYSGNFYISDFSNSRIRMVDAAGIIHTVAGNGVSASNGDGGPAGSAALYGPAGIAFDSCGNLYISEVNGGRIRKVSFNPSCLPLKVPEVPQNQITVYPNPATEEVSIDGVTTQTKWSLLNINGIIEQTGILKKGNNNINIQYLPPGIYILEMMDEEGNKTIKKIVKE